MMLSTKRLWSICVLSCVVFGSTLTASTAAKYKSDTVFSHSYVAKEHTPIAVSSGQYWTNHTNGAVAMMISHGIAQEMAAGAVDTTYDITSVSVDELAAVSTKTVSNKEELAQLVLDYYVASLLYYGKVLSLGVKAYDAQRNVFVCDQECRTALPHAAGRVIEQYRPAALKANNQEEAAQIWDVLTANNCEFYAQVRDRINAAIPAAQAQADLSQMVAHNVALYFHAADRLGQLKKAVAANLNPENVVLMNGI